MIELGALKEQLKLLGHGDLPDDQIVNILKEMNIDFDLPPPALPGACVPCTYCPIRFISMLIACRSFLA